MVGEAETVTAAALPGLPMTTGPTVEAVKLKRPVKGETAAAKLAELGSQVNVPAVLTGRGKPDCGETESARRVKAPLPVEIEEVLAK
jgi:hypothetical protein